MPLPHDNDKQASVNVTATSDKPASVMSHELRRWIAENLMMGCQPPSLIPALLNAGITAELAAQEINAALQSPYLQGADRLKNRILKRDWVLDIYRKLNRQGPARIERRHRLTGEQFHSQYYARNQPVIITGMMDQWPALRKWDSAFLKGGFGARSVEVQFGRDADKAYELNSLAHKRTMPFGDYVDLVNQRSPTNDFYMTANNDSANRESLSALWDDVPALPEYLATDDNNRGFFWFGPAGTVTPFHHDLTNNMMAQVKGRKLLRLIPACEIAYLNNQRHCFTDLDGSSIDVQLLPDMAHPQVLECVLEPGEILFLPVGCWHFVEALDISITMTFTNFRWDNDFYTNYPKSHDF